MSNPTPSIREKKFSLSINRCPLHPSYWSVCIDTIDVGGTRLTYGKCCGQWKTVESWPMTKKEVLGMIKDIREEIR